MSDSGGGSHEGGGDVEATDGAGESSFVSNRT
jgi:hypothetical protein